MGEYPHRPCLCAGRCIAHVGQSGRQQKGLVNRSPPLQTGRRLDGAGTHLIGLGLPRPAEGCRLADRLRLGGRPVTSLERVVASACPTAPERVGGARAGHHDTRLPTPHRPRRLWDTYRLAGFRRSSRVVRVFRDPHTRWLTLARSAVSAGRRPRSGRHARGRPGRDEPALAPRAISCRGRGSDRRLAL